MSSAIDTVNSECDKKQSGSVLHDGEFLENSESASAAVGGLEESKANLTESVVGEKANGVEKFEEASNETQNLGSELVDSKGNSSGLLAVKEDLNYGNSQQEITKNDNPFLDQSKDDLSGEQIVGTSETKDFEGTNASISEYMKPMSAEVKNYQKTISEAVNDEDDDLLTKKVVSDNNLSRKLTDSSGSGRLSPKAPEHQLKAIPSKVQISEANKFHEKQGRNYVAYTITYGNQVVRRRYSDFESLRNILVKLFSTSLIPPIPEKQTIKNYSKSIAGSQSAYLLPTEGTGSVDLSSSVINGSMNSTDEKLIRHRIRLLVKFLNKLLEDEEIMKTSIICDFLDPNNFNWNDFVNSSATFSSLPKSVLQCNPLDPTNTTRIHASLPNVNVSNILPKIKDSAHGTLSPMDEEFVAIEANYKQYEALMKTGFLKYNKKITKNCNDMQIIMCDLGEQIAQLANSQSTTPELAEIISHISNGMNDSSLNLENLVGLLYYNINEPLSESVHLAGSARELIKYRKLKQMQLEMVRKSLISKKEQLAKLESAELDQHQNKQQSSESSKKDASQNDNALNNSKKTYGQKLFKRFNKIANVVKESLNYQEQDPVALKCQLDQEVSQLTPALEVSTSDLEAISKIIKDDRLVKFSADRQDDINEILLNYTKYMKEYAERNLKIWKEVKASPSTQL